MSSIIDYKNRMERKGDIRTSDILYTQKFLSSRFKDSPSYFDVFINFSNEPIGVWIVSDTKDPSKKKIIMQPNATINTGDIVQKDGEYWLCLNAEHNNPIHQSAFLEKCNIFLKWIDEKSVIHSYPCVLYHNNRSSFGVDENRVMSLPDGRRQITIQNNEHTRKFSRENRFIIGGLAYRVIDLDMVSEPGLINLSLKEDQIQNVDNIELGIANYYNNINIYSIEITNGDNLTVNVGATILIDAIVKKENETVEEELVYISSNEQVAVVDGNGLVTFLSEGQVVIIVALKDNQNISDSITFNVVQEVEYNYSITIEGSDEIKYGQSKQYTASVYNNGIPVSGEIVFELFADDKTSSTQLAKITHQGSSVCTIKNNNSNSGFVQLRALLVDDPNVVQWKRIQMKPLF